MTCFALDSNCLLHEKVLMRNLMRKSRAPEEGTMTREIKDGRELERHEERLQASKRIKRDIQIVYANSSEEDGLTLRPYFVDAVRALNVTMAKRTP